MLMQGFQQVLQLIGYALLALSAFAFIDGALRREDAYRAADKKTKGFWLIILGLALAVNIVPVPGLFILQIAALVATIVYIVDVRPALRQVAGGGPRRGGSSSDGPYGPFNGR